MHEGHFIPVPTQPGRPGSKLEGRGTIDVSPAGIHLRGTKPHRLVTPLAIVTGVLSMLVVVVIIVAIEDASLGKIASGKLRAVLGIVGGLFGGYVGSALFGRILPATPVDRTVSRVTEVRLYADVVNFVVDDPELGGQYGFRTQRAPELHDSLAAR